MTQELTLIKRNILEKHDSGSVLITRAMLTWISNDEAKFIGEAAEALAVANPDYEFFVENNLDGSIKISWKKVYIVQSQGQVRGL